MNPGRTIRVNPIGTSGGFRRILSDFIGSHRFLDAGFLWEYIGRRNLSESFQICDNLTLSDVQQLPIGILRQGIRSLLTRSCRIDKIR